LVEHGADINKPDIYGVTPLSIARRRKNGLIVKYLLEHGAS